MSCLTEIKAQEIEEWTEKEREAGIEREREIEK